MSFENQIGLQLLILQISNIVGVITDSMLVICVGMVLQVIPVLIRKLQ